MEGCPANPKRIALLALDVLQLFTLEIGMRRDNAVRSVGARAGKVTVLKPALALVEHIECLRLVLLHGGNCFLKHRLGARVWTLDEQDTHATLLSTSFLRTRRIRIWRRERLETM